MVKKNSKKNKRELDKFLDKKLGELETSEELRNKIKKR